MGTRFVVFSDLHAEKPRLPLAPYAILKQVFQLAKDTEADAIICGGDWLDVRAKVPVLVYNKLLKLLTELLKESGIPLFTVVGNHDLALARGGLEASSLYAMAQALPDSLVVLSGWREFNGGYLFGRGYDPDVEAVLEIDPPPTVAKRPPKSGHKPTRGKGRVGNYTLGIFHQVTSGSEASTGWVFGEGLDPNALEGMFDLSVVGDIHQPQKVGRENRVLVPGAPYQMDFGDSGERGCWLVEIGPEGTLIEFYPLDSPQFITKRVESPRELKSFKASLKEGNFYRLSYPRELAPLVESSGLPSWVQPEEDLPEAQEVRVELEGGDKAVLSKFVEFVNPVGLDKSQLVGLGLELLEAVDA